jgi:uncharacterized membrane protein
VLFAIGGSMIALAGLCRLPRAVVLAIGAAIVAGHNLLDPVARPLARALGPGWQLLLRPGFVSFSPDHPVLVAYPVLPWMGVLALGYAAGVLFDRPPEPRARAFLALGVASSAAFLVLRGLGAYGDPTPWTGQPRGRLFTALSFVACEKYPPSLQFLLMTLGPALCLLAALDRRGPATGAPGPLTVLGRVPLFFYLTHFALLRAASAIAARARWGADAFRPPPGHAGSPEVALSHAYLAWVATLLLLYPLCRWFARLRARHPDSLLRYL